MKTSSLTPFSPNYTLYLYIKNICTWKIFRFLTSQAIWPKLQLEN